MTTLSTADFPTLPTPTVATWAPVLFRPILGSPEQHVIAVAAVGAYEFHVEQANEWRRLNCLFGSGAGTLALVAQAAISALEREIGLNGLQALSNYQPIAASVSLGELREGEASSVREVAQTWMRHLSSLYSSRQLAEISELDAIAAAAAASAERPPKERLPEQVLDFINKSNPSLSGYFSLPQKQRDPYRINIDFAGKRIVANFETLSTRGYATSVDRIKRRLWDLKVSRDGPEGHASRAHQMLVKYPPKDSLTQPQTDKIEGALQGLEQQADQEEIRLLPMTSVAEIGRHIVAGEIALPGPA